MKTEWRGAISYLHSSVTTGEATASCPFVFESELYVHDRRLHRSCLIEQLHVWTIHVLLVFWSVPKAKSFVGRRRTRSSL